MNWRDRDNAVVRRAVEWLRKAEVVKKGCQVVNRGYVVVKKDCVVFKRE